MSHTKQTTIEMYSHLYGKEVTMDDRFETKVIWSEELAIKNNGKWIPKAVTMSKQTAVQWFVDKLPHSIETQFSEQIQQALQMEMEQIQYAYWEGGMDKPKGSKECEHYYNEIYGQTKN